MSARADYQAAYYRANKDHRRAYAKRHFMENFEDYAARSKAWADANKKRRREIARKCAQRRRHGFHTGERVIHVLLGPGVIEHGPYSLQGESMADVRLDRTGKVFQAAACADLRPEDATT